MNETAWLRLSYWVAALADFLIAVLTILPDMVDLDKYEYPTGLMSAVAISWGILLIYADRNPMERRWVLLPTMIVVALLGMVTLHAFIINRIPIVSFLPEIIGSITIFTLLFISYLKTRQFSIQH